MRNLNLKTIFSLIVFGVGFFGLPLVASAQIERSFTVEPTKLEFIGENEEVLRRNIVISNNLGEDSSFSLSVEDLSVEDEDIKLDEVRDSGYSLSDFLSFNNDQVFIPAGGSREVEILINIPDNIPSNSFHGVVLVSNNKNGTTGATEVVSRIGVLTFLRLEGENKEEGRLVNFGLVGNKVHFKGEELVAFLSYLNSGNVYLNPYGYIETKNIITQNTTFTEITPWFVLPESGRTREIRLPDLSFGLHEVSVYQNRGYDNIVDEDSFYVFIINNWLIFGLVIFLLSVGIGLAYVLKFRKHDTV